MRVVTRTIGLGYLGLVLLIVVIKAFVALPGAVGYAPFPLALGPASRPIDLVVWYSPEQRAWLEDAVRRFEASGANLGGRPIRVRLEAVASPAIVERLVQQAGSAAPHAIIPASTLWVDGLRSAWAEQHGGALIRDGAEAPRPLVLSPLVAVAWEDRANVLWPNGLATVWPDLHAALANPDGWAGVVAANGLEPNSPLAQQARNWGSVKFAHPSPLTTTTGAQALILMSYAFHAKTADLTVADVRDPALRSRLQTSAAATLDLGDDPRALMEDLVRFGPNTYDLVLVYEQLALEQLVGAQSRWGQQIRVYYPPATLIGDYPFVVLDAPLTTADERGAAGVLRDFLLTRPIQELALQSGFRPAELSVSLVNDNPNNPFNLYAPFGVRAAYGRQVEAPAAAVFDALLEVWRDEIRQYTLLPQEGS
jgi:hypothetical protein